MKSRLFLIAGLTATFAASVIAQGCPTGQVGLTATFATTPNGPVFHITITGTPGAMVNLFRGPTLGQTTLAAGPLNGTVICLAAPFKVMPLGPIPPGGTKVVNLPVPPVPPGATANFQAVTALFPPPPPPTNPPTPPAPPTVDTSSVASVTVPTPPPPPPCTPGGVLLTVLPDVPVQPGNTVSYSVTGTPGAFVMLGVSHHLGSTPVPFLPSPLCLAMPLNVVHFGVIPTGGTLTHSHVVPPWANLPGNVTVYYQAVTMVPSPGAPATFDSSNTDSLMF